MHGFIYDHASNDKCKFRLQLCRILLWSQHNGVYLVSHSCYYHKRAPTWLIFQILHITLIFDIPEYYCQVYLRWNSDVIFLLKRSSRILAVTKAVRKTHTMVENYTQGVNSRILLAWIISTLYYIRIISLTVFIIFHHWRFTCSHSVQHSWLKSAPSSFECWQLQMAGGGKMFAKRE